MSDVSPTDLVAPIAQVTVCAAPGCGESPVVQWSRRLTDAEFAAILTAEQRRRDAVLLLADPQLPAPVFGPLPVQADCVRAVHACGVHAIDLDAAAQVHGSACTAPDLAHLPACGCTPEPIPVSAPTAVPTVTLATGWTVPAPPAA